MREITVPLGIDIPADAALPDTVFRHADETPDFVALRRPVGGEWRPVTARQFADEVRALAAGFVDAGIEPGDRVALMSRTRYEWTLVDYALWTVGAVPVPVYETSSAEQVEWILADSGAVAAVVETDAHASVVEKARRGAPDVRDVWQIEGGDLDALAARAGGTGVDDVDRRRHAVRADDLATVVYTSGTTGRPKGCALTHRNLLARALPVPSGLEQLLNEGGSTLLFLPLAHIFARVIEVGAIEHRVCLGHTADVKHLLDHFAGFEPTFILSVPRVFEKVFTTARQRARADGAGAIFDRAAAIAVRYSEALDAGGPSLALRARRSFYDRLVYRKLRQALGGRVKYAVSGGAPLGATLGHFFRGIGVTVLDGYGLTETTAGATVNLPDAMRIGTVGRPIPGARVRIADDGEILLGGDFVFGGYWRADDATARVLVDGWFHTGDVGELDDDGYLTITGRKKELIVTAAGKNVAPAVLEERVRAHPLVAQCVVVGDGRPYVAALVTIDQEALAAWRKERGGRADAAVEDARDDPDLRAEVQAAVDEANRAVSRAESIRAFTILADDFTEESGELTPTLKIRRDVVLRRRASDVQSLYA